MISIIINSEPVSLNYQGLENFTDLVELIKSYIDPDHMITQLELDGDQISDEIWRNNISDITGKSLNVVTGNPTQYVADQIARTPLAIQACYLQFRDARKTFQQGDTATGNKKLIIATDTLKAFFDWYIVILQLAPTHLREIINLESKAGEILSVCKNICQLQMYRSWWALGESLKNDLEPKLDSLEDHCRTMSTQYFDLVGGQ
jgi:hypothetical protein